MSHIQSAPLTPTLPLTTRLLRQYATAITTALFAVIAVTGILMFFHLQERLVKSAHEWLGLIFVAGAAFHVARNWSAFANLVTKRRSLAIFIVVMAITGGFIASASGTGGEGNPMARVVKAVERAPLSAVAPVLGQPADQMIERLRSAGYPVSGPDDSLAEIAAAGQTRLPNLLRVILDEKPR
ncbi:DUF4405 domain-containing protein [Telmatospirillum siberiense]|uniref:DUF4405 domain-containing protein n=1 Tax=Telmatospirillum siberiense TaxID=382514 RepID=UPI0013041A7F|nr:DUF4405 domain-containing protein [Telmatospirillum siberiense]